MKTSNKILLSLLILILCSITVIMIRAKDNFEKQLREKLTGDRNIIEQKRELPEFNQIVAKDHLSVIFTQNDEQKIVVEADSNLLNTIITEVEGNTLRLYTKTPIRRAKRKQIHISAPNISKIEGREGVQIKTTNKLKGNKLQLNLNTGSKADINVKVQTLNSSCTAGSIAKLSGTSQNLSINASAGSIIKASELIAQECNISATAGCIIHVDVQEKFDVSASAGSVIHYSGTPQMGNMNLSSGARINKK